MPLTPIVVDVVEEKDETFTVTIHVVDTDNNNKIIFRAPQFNASSKADFKDKVRPHLARFIARQQRKAQLITIANNALDEVKDELGY